MISSVLVVCVGNICRSPVGERLLAGMVPGVRVESAGLGALVGQGADETAAAVAADHDVSLQGHVARLYSREIARNFDLILVMEAGHRHELMWRTPELGGHCLLFGKWAEIEKIPDPYRKSTAFHRSVFSMLETSALMWAERLNGVADV